MQLMNTSLSQQSTQHLSKVSFGSVKGFGDNEDRAFSFYMKINRENRRAGLYKLTGKKLNKPIYIVIANNTHGNNPLKHFDEFQKLTTIIQKVMYIYNKQGFNLYPMLVDEVETYADCPNNKF